jgi:hypothetical protein
MRHLITSFIKNSVFGMNEMTRFSNTGAGFMNIDESLIAQIFSVHSGRSQMEKFLFFCTLTEINPNDDISTDMPTLESEK